MKKNGEESVIQELKKCYWYRSPSISKDQKIWYTACHKLCSGVDEACEKYVSKSTLEKKLSEEELQ